MKRPHRPNQTPAYAETRIMATAIHNMTIADSQRAIALGVQNHDRQPDHGADVSGPAQD